MSEPKVIYLGPACQDQSSSAGREWCQDDIWDACQCGHGSVRYVLATEFDRVTAERDALQQRLNAADQRIDELERYKMSIWPSEDTLIAAGLGYPIGKEQAVKIYKAALKSRTDTPENADCEWCYGAGHDYYGEPCCGCCKPDPEALARLIAENASRGSIVLPADQPAGKIYKSQKLRRGFRDGWSACLHTVKALNHSQ